MRTEKSTQKFSYRRIGKFQLLPTRKHTTTVSERPFGKATTVCKEFHWLFWVWGTQTETVSVNTDVKTTDILKGRK